MRHLALLLALLLAPSFLSPSHAHADPALFVARAPGLTAYILGSVHALKPGTEWRTPEIGTALDAASECWFETILPDDPGAAMSLILPGLDSERHLPALLGPVDHALLEQRAKTLAMPGGVGFIDMMHPWLAYITLAALEIKAAGLDENSGVDKTLQLEATAAHKPVFGFETPEQQVGFFSAQPEPMMVRLLHDQLRASKETRRLLDRMVPAWLAGDLPTVAHQMNAATDALGPEFTRILLTGRNQAWADRLDGMRGSGKTIFVTVGAGHLAGPGNLRDELGRRHFTVTRVPKHKDPTP